MISNPDKGISGVILDEHTEVTLDDLCHACRVEQSSIIALVDEGIVEPRTRDIQPWRFSSTTLPRVARALRLQKDLDLNPPGTAFVLELLAEIETLQNRLNFIEGKTELSS